MAEKELNLIVSPDRLKEVDLETIYFLENNPKSMVDFLATFLADENDQYYENHIDAVKIIVKGRKLRDIEDMAKELQEAIENGVVPNE